MSAQGDYVGSINVDITANMDESASGQQQTVTYRALH